MASASCWAHRWRASSSVPAPAVGRGWSRPRAGCRARAHGSNCLAASGFPPVLASSPMPAVRRTRASRCTTRWLPLILDMAVHAHDLGLLAVPFTFTDLADSRRAAWMALSERRHRLKFCRRQPAAALPWTSPICAEMRRRSTPPTGIQQRTTPGVPASTSCPAAARPRLDSRCPSPTPAPYAWS